MLYYNNIGPYLLFGWSPSQWPVVWFVVQWPEASVGTRAAAQGHNGPLPSWFDSAGWWTSFGNNDVRCQQRSHQRLKRRCRLSCMYIYTQLFCLGIKVFCFKWGGCLYFAPFFTFFKIRGGVCFTFRFCYPLATVEKYPRLLFYGKSLKDE